MSMDICYYKEAALPLFLAIVPKVEVTFARGRRAIDVSNLVHLERWQEHYL
jgi:hypothetical protein